MPVHIQNRSPSLFQRMMHIVNPLVTGILRSPLHFLLSGHLLVISVRGSKTGRLYSIPVEYYQDGNMLTIVTHTRRMWWHNLTDGMDVMLHLRGFDVHAVASVITDGGAVTAAVEPIYHLSPDRAIKFAEEKVVLRLRLAAMPATHAHG